MTGTTNGLDEVLMSKKRQCRQCGFWFLSKEVHQVFEFDDEDGKPVWLCNECYQEHEDKGDWVS